MLNHFNQLLHRLRPQGQQAAARAALFAQVQRFRQERSDLLARIGEGVAVWHRAGGENERLLTESLRQDLRRLGELEDAIQAALPLLQVDDAQQVADEFAPRSSMLADADGHPQVIRAAPSQP
ncbi:MAG: hypothetical protein GEEBNDBF_00992 [bacterium]|nr:hypothetical protein [bacterium]